MGRNYIAEKTIADPRQRAAELAKRKREKDARRAVDRASLAAYLERSKWCRNDCGRLALGGPEGWYPCCSEACWSAWEATLH